MHLIFNIYSIVLLLSGLISLLTALFIFQRIGGAATWFGLMMLTIVIWSICYGFELASVDLHQMLLWSSLKYTGICLLSPTGTIFIIHYIGKEAWLKKRNIVLIFFIPVLTLALVWTNSWHHLIFKELSLNLKGPYPLLFTSKNFGYWIFIAYFYSSLISVTCTMIFQYRRGDAILKKQIITLLIAAFIPWLIHLLGLIGVTSRLEAHHGIDFTPFTFIITSLLIGWGLLSFGLFDIIPIARGKIIEDLRDGVLVLDTHHRIIDLNAEMKKLIATTSNVVGMSLEEALPFPNQLSQLILKKLNEKIELEIPKDFEVHFMEVESIPLFNKKKTYNGVILLFKNITERKKAALQLDAQAKELQALNQLKDRLFSIISHDLRSPLINLFEVLNTHRIGLLTEQELNKLLVELAKDINYTSTLIENLLYWSKNQLHGKQINPINFDFKRVCEREVSYFKTKAKEKDVIIEDTITPSTMVFADVQMIQLVMRNLISNSIKFCTPGNSIKIFSTVNKTNEIIISVEDSGIGIPETELKKLFTLEFFTTRGTDNENGTGLGLLLCKEFVEKNKGSIGVESSWGNGSRFYFTLPLC